MLRELRAQVYRQNRIPRQHHGRVAKKRTAGQADELEVIGGLA